VTTGTEALKFLPNALPEVVFLDVMMPGIDGLEVLRRIRANEAYKNVKVIMYSAMYDPEKMRQALDLGADRYVVKGSLDYTELELIVKGHETHLN
jgi:CheY-like chemotaxis protein